MNLFQFIIPRENISGLSIEPKVLRLVYLTEASGSAKKVQSTSEVELPDSVIEQGLLKKPKVLTAAAAKLLKQAKPKPLKFPYVIASLPQANTYSQLITFPPLPEYRLAEAVSVNAALTLPLSLSQAYLDWQVVEELTDRIVVLVSLAARTIVDPYIQALKEAGLQLIALEMPSFSLGRVFNLPPAGMSVLLRESIEGLLAVAYKNNLPLFVRQQTWGELGFNGNSGAPALEQVSEIMGREIRRLRAYLTVEHPAYAWQPVQLHTGRAQAQTLAKSVSAISGSEVRLATNIINGLPSNEWLSAAGAACRGLIPRSQDSLNSLLPVGTESLYEQQKTLSFISTARTISLVVLGLYLAVYLGVFLLLNWMNIGLARQVERQSKLPLSPETAVLEYQARDFNARVSELQILPPLPQALRSRYIKATSALATAGINFTHLTIPEGEPVVINIQATAQTRENLVNFKRRLEASSGVGSVRLPVANLVLKENIPFSVNFTLDLP
ncbi:MAG: pilus assembly protein PilM [Candidatus Kerfeldbacteria bacterium]|nr:pilus assembly protein PilM [Candidatus Kerfeldbacteria bacterium]